MQWVPVHTRASSVSVQAGKRVGDLSVVQRSENRR